MWQHVNLSEQIHPWDTLACCQDVRQPTNNKQQIEGSLPEWCISSMLYSRGTPFWSETLEIRPISMWSLHCPTATGHGSVLVLHCMVSLTLWCVNRKTWRTEEETTTWCGQCSSYTWATCAPRSQNSCSVMCLARGEPSSKRSVSLQLYAAHSLLPDHLVGLVVKVWALRMADQGLIATFAVDFFTRRVKPSLVNGSANKIKKLNKCDFNSVRLNSWAVP